MKRESEVSQAVPVGRVVHVVGEVTDEVFSFLGPAAQALARSGLRQSVVMIDELRYRHHVVSLDESADLLLVPQMRSTVQQWQAVAHACTQALASGRVHAVHMHGLLPWMAGAWAVRRSGLKVPVFYSPHGSRSLGTLRTMGSLALLLFLPFLRPSRSGAIVNAAPEAQAFDQWRSVELVESPVNEAFFAVQRHEARHPLVVTGGRPQGAARSSESMAQLAVLLSGEALRISFNWFGSVDRVSHQRLTAANVGVVDVHNDTDYASRLAAGWIYVAPGSTRGFPLCLVEAMAAGMPCVALDCEQHRSVLRDGETGFLCASEHEMMQRVAVLIDDPALRARLGSAARAEAHLRFSEATFNSRLLAAYAAPPSAMPEVAMGKSRARETETTRPQNLASSV